MTNHKPLVNLLSDKALDQIVNARLFSLKQRTLPLEFSIYLQAGINDKFTDTTSYDLVNETEDDISKSKVIAGIMLRYQRENVCDKKDRVLEQEVI